MSTKPSMQNLNGKCGAAQSPFIKANGMCRSMYLFSTDGIQSIVKGFFLLQRMVFFLRI